MCVILHCEKAIPTLDDLKKMEAANSAGGGVAWFEKNRVRWSKGIRAKAIFEIISSMPPPFVIHFRLATVGGVKKTLCHPFPISPDSELLLNGTAHGVLFHNGHCTNWEQLALAAGVELKGDVSDTRALAAITARNQNPNWLKTITDRFAIMTGGEVHRLGNWTEEGGIHYSNTFWRYRPAAVYSGGDWHGSDWRDEYRNYRGGDTGAHTREIGFGAVTEARPHSDRCTCQPCMDNWRIRKGGNPAMVGYAHGKKCKCRYCKASRKLKVSEADSRSHLIDCGCPICQARIDAATALREPLNPTELKPKDKPFEFAWPECVKIGGVWMKRLDPYPGHIPEHCQCVQCAGARRQAGLLRAEAAMDGTVTRVMADAARMGAETIGATGEADKREPARLWTNDLATNESMVEQ